MSAPSSYFTNGSISSQPHFVLLGVEIPALRRNQALISSVYMYSREQEKKNLTMIRLRKKFNYKINRFVMETLNIKYSNKYLHIYR